MRTRALALVATVMLAIVGVAGCGGTETDQLTVQDGPVGDANAITPAELKAEKGHKVEIKVTNTATDKPHGFSIDSYGVAKTLEPGKTETISFTADKAGTYRVYCQLHPTHQPAQLVIT